MLLVLKVPVSFPPDHCGVCMYAAMVYDIREWKYTKKHRGKKRERQTIYNPLVGIPCIHTAFLL